MDEQGNNTDDGQTPVSNQADGDLQEQRIADFMKESLSVDNTLESNLGALNAQIMLIAKRYGTVMSEAAAMKLDTLLELDEMGIRFNHYLKLTKQIDRFASLALKIRKEGG